MGFFIRKYLYYSTEKSQSKNANNSEQTCSDWKVGVKWQRFCKSKKHLWYQCFLFCACWPCKVNKSLKRPTNWILNRTWKINLSKTFALVKKSLQSWSLAPNGRYYSNNQHNHHLLDLPDSCRIIYILPLCQYGYLGR